MSVMRISGLLGVSIHTSAASLRQRRAHRRLVSKVDELHLELAAPLPLAEQAMAAAVAVVRRDDARADVEQVADQRDRAHAGAGDDGARAPLQVGQRAAQQVARGIGGAGIVVGPLLAVAVEGIGGAQEYGRHHRAGHGIAHQPGAHRAGCRLGTWVIL